ncbi:Nitrogen regulation protein C [Anaerohalosphaera lusitana]|uniref:Nitrogen regulation protein C n=1 Tax=Anaerohalosphaera lusitana TaxID=1936003 RepID=A0A1U9NNM4_9BACT|nr:response regulator transcription factor [Anaerohalosphaera lusitana]AQT69435.1 Nitrogen regulation protein C [Anaerohalosphaera lusitana]
MNQHVKATDVKKARILLVDDHPIVRQGLSELINHEDDMVVCGHAEESYEAMSFIRNETLDMVIVDISLRETSGMELIKDIRAQRPHMPILTLSMHDESLYAERALRAGANGYVMKQEATDVLVGAIRKVMDGELHLSDNMAARMVRKLVGGKMKVESSPIDRLSDRELEVFRLTGQGLGTRHIAERLHLSIKTIETYRAHIKEKLSLGDAAELLQYAIQWVNSEVMSQPPETRT